MPRVSDFTALGASLFFAFTSLTASATILMGAVTGGSAQTAGGTFVKLPVPLTGSTPANTVGSNNFQSPNLFGFDESQNILLSAVLDMDIGASLAAGTQVASHYVFFDPAGMQNLVGSVEFDADILGIIMSPGLLQTSDILANTSVNYLNHPLRGIEAGDSVTISGPRQLRWDTTSSATGDYVRVITGFSPGATIPEPVSISLVLAALAGAGIARRRAF